MAFLDTLKNKTEDLKSRTKSMGNQLSDMARDSSEQRRLESEIKKLDADIENAYKAIGRNVFESRQAGTEPEVDARIRAVSDMLAQIAEKRKRIEAIKSQIVCPNCGKLMPAGTLFCTACGRSMEKREAPADNRPRCPRCGDIVDPGDVFCMTCGTKLGSAAAQDGSPAAATEQAPEETPAETPAEKEESEDVLS